MLQILVDLSYLAHRAFHAMGSLQFEDIPTGVVYGFWEQIRTLAIDPHIRSNQLFFFYDSRQSYRRQFWPPYKAQRQEYTEEQIQQRVILNTQIDMLRDLMLPECGFRVFRQTGCESDDLLAQAARQLSMPTMPRELNGVIVTGDGDLYQCISKEVHWYDPGRSLYHDPLTFWVEKGVCEHQWAMVKAIGGCKSDGVPGVEGVAERTAICFLTQTLKETSQRYKNICSEQGQAVIRRNLALVTLPHPKTRSIDLIPPTYRPPMFFEFCKNLGLKSYLEGSKRREWDMFFAGVLTGQARQPTRKRGEHRG